MRERTLALWRRLQRGPLGRRSCSVGCRCWRASVHSAEAKQATVMLMRRGIFCSMVIRSYALGQSPTCTQLVGVRWEFLTRGS